jgi:hypothetical protein
MARKPNKSQNSGIVNRLQELESRFKQRMDLPTGAESDILERIGAAQQSIEAITSSPNSIGPQAASDIAAYTQEIERLYRQLAPLERGREVGATRSYIASIGSALRSGNLSREVNSVAGASSSLSAAISMVNIPTYQLEQMRAQAMSTMNNAAGVINQSVVNDPMGGLKSSSLGALGAALNTAAQAQAALTMQRRMGMDINSRYIESRETFGRISDYLGAKDLADNVRAGKMGTRADVEAGLRSDVSQIERFQAAQNRYVGDPEKFERFQRAIDKLTESASKAARTLREMDRQGIGGGSFLSNAKVQAGLQLVQAGAQFGQQIMDTWTFTNPLREKQNQTSYANLGNRQFDDTLAALSGDMSALRRLGGTYSDAQNTSKSTQTGSKVSSGFGLLRSLAGAGLGAGVGITAAAAAGTGVGIPIALGLIAGAGAVNYFAGSYHQQAGERGAAMAEAEIARQNALSRINDTSAQSYRDYATNIGQATVGLGAQRGWNFDILNNVGGMRQLARVGIDTNRAAQLTAMGVGAMGGEFSTNQLIRAGEARQAGIMNEQQYFQSVGQLTSVGGNADKNLEEILKNAVANGMDNAKSVAQMVQATAQLASHSAATGISTAEGSRNVVSRIMDSLTDQGTPMNMRGAVAASASAFVQNTLSDTSTNLYTLGRWTNIGRAFRGASRAQMEFLSQMTAEDVAQLGGANGVDYAKQTGIDNLVVGADGKIDKTKLSQLQRAQREQVINRVLGIGLSETARKGLLESTSYEDFEARIARGEIDEQAGRDVRSVAARLRQNVGAIFSQVDPKAVRSGAITRTGGDAGEIDQQAVIAAQGQARLVEQGKDIIEALGGLKGLTDALNSVAKNFNPKEMSEGVQKAAKDFNIPVRDFGKAVDAFSSAVSRMTSTKR